MASRPLLYYRRIERVHPLMSPQLMREKIPVSKKASQTVLTGRKEVEAILSGADDRSVFYPRPSLCAGLCESAGASACKISRLLLYYHAGVF